MEGRKESRIRTRKHVTYVNVTPPKRKLGFKVGERLMVDSQDGSVNRQQEENQAWGSEI